MSLDIPQILFGDAILYHNLALGLLNEQTFHGTLRMTGYPSFIAFIYWIFGVNPGAVLAVQILLHILTIFVLYYLIKALFSKKAALIGACLYSIEPLSWYYTFTLLPETLFTFLFLSAFTLLVKSRYFLSGIIFGLSIFVRPVPQYYPFLLMFVLLLRPNYLKSCGMLLLGIFLMTSPWMVRTYV